MNRPRMEVHLHSAQRRWLPGKPEPVNFDEILNVLPPLANLVAKQRPLNAVTYIMSGLGAFNELVIATLEDMDISDKIIMEMKETATEAALPGWNIGLSVDVASKPTITHVLTRSLYESPAEGPA